MKKILLSLFMFPVICIGQSWQDTSLMIDKLLDRYKPANPGCQLAISRNGQTIYSRSWGMADLEHGVKLTNESIIEAGSISKQFTAAAILLLEQQGKLSLNDDVRKYIPELPAYGTPILLRQMMQHTSGLKDWGSIADIAGWPRGTKTYSNEDALYIIRRQKTLNNIPGAEYIYSNSNYNLFAIIVERVSGKSLSEFTRIHIFEPAGMKHTEWRNNYKKVVINRAIAYQKTASGYETDMPNEYVYGNGGLLTTAEDLLAWNNYYLHGKLGNPSLLSKQLSTTRLNNGRANNYGAGLRLDSLRGQKTIGHGGATASYRANIEYYPAYDLTIAWLSNTSEFDQSPSPAFAVTNLLVKDLSVPVRRNETNTVTIQTEKLNSYTGWYREPRSATSVKLFIRDGKLANSRGGELVPITENEFRLGNARLQILTAKPRRIQLIAPSDTLVYMGMDSARITETTLAEYAGSFYSDEAETKILIKVQDGKLIAHRDPQTNYTLAPTYKDGFDSPAGGVVFERDKKNRIITMKLFTGRARNVEFRKVP